MALDVCPCAVGVIVAMAPQTRTRVGRNGHVLTAALDGKLARRRDPEHVESGRSAFRRSISRTREPNASSRCQRSVRASVDDGLMTAPDSEQVIHQLAVGDAVAIATIVAESRTSDNPLILVAAALFASDGSDLLARAVRVAVTTRDRQLVAIASAHLSGDGDLVDALARDHLVDHPDSVLVAWIAAASQRSHTPHGQSSDRET